MITQEELKENLHYNTDTGIFTLKVSNRKTKTGATVGTVTQGYIVVRVKGETYLAHRLAWLYVYGTFPNELLDHINGDGTDNRILNLREANKSENGQNRRKAQSNNKTGYIGVHLHKGANKYVAQIQKDGKSIYLGLFDTAVEAHEVYLKAKRKLHEYSTI